MSTDNPLYHEVTVRCPARKRSLLNSIGFVLIIWDLLLGLPISYGVTHLVHKVVVRHVHGTQLAEALPAAGKQALYAILQDDGVMAMRASFVILNLVIVLSWAVQLVEKDKERVRDDTLVEIRWWDNEIGRLESLLWESEEKELQEQIQREFQQSIKPPRPSSVVQPPAVAGKDWESALRRKGHSRTPSLVSTSSKKSVVSKMLARSKKASLQVSMNTKIEERSD